VGGDWIAGDVRALVLVAGDVSDIADTVAATPDLEAAIATLAETRWIRDEVPAVTVEAAQREVYQSLLWHLRVLAGWLPAEGVEAIRSCLLWFEIRNIEDRLGYFAGAPAEAMYELGRLGLISRRLESTGSAEDIRWLMHTSAWHDPGADDAYSIRIWLRHAWHQRVRDAAPELRVWADAATWLFAVRERVAQRPGAEVLAAAPPALPSAWQWATSVQWSAQDLWRGEQRWWTQVREEGLKLLHKPVGTTGPVIGALTTLASSAHRIATALEVAAAGSRGGRIDVAG